MAKALLSPPALRVQVKIRRRIHKMNFESYFCLQSLIWSGFLHFISRLICKRSIKDQLERASLSIVLNLAEGSAKTTAKERARFYSIAYASLRETQVLLEILEQTELLKKSQ